MAIAAQFILPSAFVAGLAAASIRVWQRVSGQVAKPGARKLAVVDSLPVGSSGKLVVVQFDNREILLSVTKSALSLVCISEVNGEI